MSSPKLVWGSSPSHPNTFRLEKHHRRSNRCVYKDQGRRFRFTRQVPATGLFLIPSPLPFKEVIEELTQDILCKLPKDFNLEVVMKLYPVVYEESMNTVLRQELIRFNRWAGRAHLGPRGGGGQRGVTLAAVEVDTC